ncbi:MAG: hypothetical protein H7X92_07750 [Chitinophagales bacterium]|nr:hypothetical protein [Hyphomicrobiales bacterium]
MHDFRQRAFVVFGPAPAVAVQTVGLLVEGPHSFRYCIGRYEMMLEAAKHALFDLFPRDTQFVFARPASVMISAGVTVAAANCVRPVATSADE